MFKEKTRSCRVAEFYDFLTLSSHVGEYSASHQRNGQSCMVSSSGKIPSREQLKVRDLDERGKHGYRIKHIHHSSLELCKN